MKFINLSISFLILAILSLAIPSYSIADNIIELPLNGKSGAIDKFISYDGASEKESNANTHKTGNNSIEFRVHNGSLNTTETIVITAKKASYIGSGLLAPNFEHNKIRDLSLLIEGNEAYIKKVKDINPQAFTVDFPPNSNSLIKIQFSGRNVNDVEIWNKKEFTSNLEKITLFQGLLIGVVLVISIYMISLLILRRRLVFLGSTIISWSIVIFFFIEFGYLNSFINIDPNTEYKIRAFTETFLLLGALTTFYNFIELNQRLPFVRYITLTLIGISIGAMAYGIFITPKAAIILSRVLLPIFAIFGLIIIIKITKEAVIMARASLVSWTFLTLTSLLLLLASTNIFVDIITNSIMAISLVVMVLILASTCTQFAFDAGIIASRFFEDSGRRALALVGANQCVWDWREDIKCLYIGPELEKSLGFPKGKLSNISLDGWFKMIHNDDRRPYKTAIELAILKRKNYINQEFRIRHNDGTYRWYHLRASALAGEHGNVVRCIGTITDITIVKRSENKLLRNSINDQLTGLPNKALLIDRISRAINYNKDEISLLVIDIDGFKFINNRLGLSVGDNIIMTIAKRLKSFVGPGDTLARMMGDTFAIIINSQKADIELEKIIKKISSAISEPIHLRPRDIFITASIGVCKYNDKIINAEELIKNAEIALYEAKKQGRNQVKFFRTDMQKETSVLISMENELKKAVDTSEIEVLYQPIANMEDGRLAGFEALARWNHPKRGRLGAEEFIGLAEDVGLIGKLGNFVLAEASRQLGIWQRAFRPKNPFFVSVNLSTKQILDYNLVEEIKTIMKREDLKPNSLKLELTESHIMENAEISIEILEKIKAQNVMLSCDDFGTGYSSLSHLQQLPFDFIKIDRSFVTTEDDHRSSEKILKFIINLSHELKMKVIAEGIEDEEKYNILKKLKCDMGQGYLLGKPLTAKEVVDRLGNKARFFDDRLPKFTTSVFSSGTKSNRNKISELAANSTVIEFHDNKKQTPKEKPLKQKNDDEAKLNKDSPVNENVSNELYKEAKNKDQEFKLESKIKNKINDVIAKEMELYSKNNEKDDKKTKSVSTKDSANVKKDDIKSVDKTTKNIGTKETNNKKSVKEKIPPEENLLESEEKIEVPKNKKEKNVSKDKKTSNSGNNNEEVKKENASKTS